jgi:large subunit ribosomal protein L1
LNVDPKQGDQNIRGTCLLPAGTGKNVIVCVFADSERHEELKASGVDIIGNEEVLKSIAEGNIKFDKLVVTADQLQSLKPYARILGPKGLMPNVKSGTLVKPDELIPSIKLMKQGQIEFRINPNSDIMVKIGIKDFDENQIMENFDSLAKALVAKKPDSVKGKYFTRGYIRTSAGAPIKLDLSYY